MKVLDLFEKLEGIPFGKRIFTFMVCMNAPYFFSIRSQITELKKKLFDLKMSSYVSELENPIQIRNTRRIIARLKTAKTKLIKDLIFKIIKN